MNSLFSSGIKDALLDTCLQNLFGNLTMDQWSALKSKFKILSITADEILFNADDEADSMYFVLSGKLQVSTRWKNESRIIAQLIKGDSVGEIALITGENRSATVRAVRETVLAQLTKNDFEEIIRVSPEIYIPISKNVIKRLAADQNRKKRHSNQGNLTLILDQSTPVTEMVLHEIRKYIQETSTLLILHYEDIIQNSFTLEEHFFDDLYFLRWIEEQEDRHDIVLFVAESHQKEWIHKCIAHSDDIFYLVHADFPISEKINLPNRTLKGIIVLNQEGASFSHSTVYRDHPEHIYKINIRQNNIEDYHRLARIMSGKAIGLVLSGGGAKGFAHLGVYKALLEAGVRIDFVGGTSMGALLGGFIAMDLTLDAIIEFVRHGASLNPMGDYTIFPYHSIIKGKRLDFLINKVLKEIHATNLNIEDLWLGFFSVSCNYTNSNASIHVRGNLYKALRASISIPGIFPPVIQNAKLLMDGGSYNNFPTDIMHSVMGAAHIIGVEIERDKLNIPEMDFLPDNSTLFWDQFNPFRKRKYHTPSILNLLLNATLFYSDFRKEELEQYADVLFKPDVSKFNMLDWSSFDEIIEIGYHHAKDILNRLSSEERINLGLK